MTWPDRSEDVTKTHWTAAFARPRFFRISSLRTLVGTLADSGPTHRLTTESPATSYITGGAMVDSQHLAAMVGKRGPLPSRSAIESFSLTPCRSFGGPLACKSKDGNRATRRKPKIQKRGQDWIGCPHWTSRFVPRRRDSSNQESQTDTKCYVTVASSSGAFFEFAAYGISRSTVMRRCCADCIN